MENDKSNSEKTFCKVNFFKVFLVTLYVYISLSIFSTITYGIYYVTIVIPEENRLKKEETDRLLEETDRVHEEYNKNLESFEQRRKNREF